MNQIDFVKNQKQNQTIPALVWIIASIMFHLLILLLIMTDKFNIFEQEPPQQAIRPNDQVILWTNQPQPIPAQKTVLAQPEPKKEIKEQTKSNPEPKQKTQPPIVQEMPIILPGKKGSDKQDLKINDSLLGQQIPVEIAENMSEEFLPQEQKPLMPNPDEQTQNNQQLYTTTPLVLSKANHFIRNIPKQTPHKESEIKKATSENQYQFVPKPTKQKPVRVASFKDLGISFDETSQTFGNSKNIKWLGNSLQATDKNSAMRWNNYARSTATLILNSLHFHPQLKLIPPQQKPETLSFYVKINRTGQVLEARMIDASKNPMINHIILDSIKRVGLFNSFSKFTKEDEWHCTFLL